MRANYAECVRRVLLSEGGYSNDPRDPGGPTNWGITLADARAYWRAGSTAEDVREMPRSVAETIYREKYWAHVHGDELPAGVDYTLFDYAVNSGWVRACCVLKATLGLPASRDKWELTPEVLEVLNRANPVEVVDRINTERMAFLMGLKTWPTFGHGWGKRVVAVKAYSEALAKRRMDTPAPEHPADLPPHGKAYGNDEPIVVEVLKELLPDWLVRSKAAQEDTVAPQGSSPMRSDEVPATPIAPDVQNEPTATKPPSMWGSKTGWASIGLGGAGVMDGLSKVQDYAFQLQSVMDTWDTLRASDVLAWVYHHPAVLMPVAVVAAAAFVWADHRKYKRLLHEAQNK